MVFLFCFDSLCFLLPYYRRSFRGLQVDIIIFQRLLRSGEGVLVSLTWIIL